MKASSNSLLNAVRTFLLRESGLQSPEGGFDNARRWFPQGRDKEVMADVRYPSRSFPFSYLKACKSIKHCAALFDADPAEVRRLAKQVRAEVDAEMLKGQAALSTTIAAKIELHSQASVLNSATAQAVGSSVARRL